LYTTYVLMYGEVCCTPHMYVCMVRCVVHHICTYVWWGVLYTTYVPMYGEVTQRHLIKQYTLFSSTQTWKLLIKRIVWPWNLFTM